MHFIYFFNIFGEISKHDFNLDIVLKDLGNIVNEKDNTAHFESFHLGRPKNLRVKLFADTADKVMKSSLHFTFSLFKIRLHAYMTIW